MYSPPHQPLPGFLEEQERRAQNSSVSGTPGKQPERFPIVVYQDAIISFDD